MRQGIVLVLMALMTATAAFPAGSTAAPPTSTTSTDLDKSNLEHVRLDNDRLKRDASTEASVQRWLPGVSAVIAIVAAGLGLWRYLDERRRDRRLKIEQAITGNLERIVDRPPGHMARVIVSLRSLDSLAPASPGCRQRRDLPHQARERVTDTVEAVVRHELLQADTPDAAMLPRILVQEWPPLADRFERDPVVVHSVLDRYRQTLKKVYDSEPLRAAALTVEASGASRVVTSPQSPLDVETLSLLNEVVAGYQVYAGLLKDPQMQRTARLDLGSVLSNPAIVGQIWLDTVAVDQA
jgi:hypothetical protein